MIFQILHILHHSPYSEEGVDENKGTKNYRKPFRGVIGEMEDMEDHESRKFS
jgi:hypothetical protein